MPAYRSVSQVTQYEKCPHAYYLARMEKAWQRPAAWLPHGTAFHYAIEQYELSERTLSLEKVKEIFLDKYIAEVNEYCKTTPNLGYWAKSGRYGGAEDIQRRMVIGQEMVEKYFKYVAEHPEEQIWITPEGKPAIEYEFFSDFDGVTMKGYIDRIILHLILKDLEVDDLKTGQNPGDLFQLKVYSIAVKNDFGIEILRGRYWMGKTGKPTKTYDLTEMSENEVFDRIHAADEGIKAEQFDPKPSKENCRRCDVRTACPFAI